MTRRTNSSDLLRRATGDVVAVEIEPEVFCYVRKYAFGHGILPFFSSGGVLPLDRLPSITADLFFDVWVYRDDLIRTQFVGSFPFDRAEESWDPPAYEPPDAIEPCFKIHGVFNGVASIIKPAKEEQIAGMRVLKRYQPAQFSAFLAKYRSVWPTITV
jgi:hypothetical protein